MREDKSGGSIPIAKKMRRWCDIARCPSLDRRCTPGRARKNYWYLWRKYPEIAAKLGLHQWSVFERF